MRWATGKSSVEMNERTSSNSAGSLLVVAELEIRMFPYSRNHIKYNWSSTIPYIDMELPSTGK
jgi:hypothetical protein